MTHKMQQRVVLEVPRFDADIGPDAEYTTLQPLIVSSAWKRNSHLESDELTVTFTWRDSGVDVRLLKNARIVYYLWDANEEDFDAAKHLRFVGVAYEAKRSGSESDMAVEIVFHDYTSLFLEHALPATGIPEWADTLETAWGRICDNTGWEDPGSGGIVSSVTALRNRLVFRLANPEFQTKTLGSIINPRFHAVSKPTPPRNSNAWAVWQWCVGALGLISYIDRDQCIVTDVGSFFSEENAPQAIWGENILTIEERANAKVAGKGILLKSFDPLTGQALEAAYPPLADPKVRRQVTTRRANANVGGQGEQSSAEVHYEEQSVFWITNQEALDAKARSVWEQWSRQSVEGMFSTAETNLYLSTGDKVSLLDLTPGDLVGVSFGDQSLDFLTSLSGDEQRVRYLVDVIDLSDDLARVIVQNSAGMVALKPVFNVKGVSVDIAAESFKCEVRYWNRVHS